MRFGRSRGFIGLTYRYNDMIGWMIISLSSMSTHEKRNMRRIGADLRREGVDAVLFDELEDDPMGKSRWSLCVDYQRLGKSVAEVVQTLEQIAHVKEVRHVSYH